MYTWKSESFRPPNVELQVGDADLLDELLQASLADSEEQYRVNIVHRLERYQVQLLRGQLSPSINISMESLKHDFLIPLYPCGLEGRFGLWGEGGKWICLRHYGRSSQPLVISIGSNGDTSFEEAMFARMNAFCHTFDFTLKPQQQLKMRDYAKFLKFYNAGLSGSGALQANEAMFPKASFVTVPEMLQMIGANYIDIFKIDCEGCEHAVVKDMTRYYTRETAPFGQIQMEIHHIENTTDQMVLLLGLESLGYRMFHAEINGWWRLGYEIAYIHERLVKPRLPSAGAPDTSLDMGPTSPT